MTNIIRGVFLATLLMGSAQLMRLPGVESAAAGSPGAVLGASLGDWTHVLGPRMKGTSDTAAGWSPCANGVVPKVFVSFYVGASGGSGAMENEAVQVNGAACPGRTLTVAQRRAMALRYLPRDARAHGTIRTNHGMDELFTSKWLAGSQDPRNFESCRNAAVPAGTITLNLHDAHNRGWQLAEGTCA